MKTKHQWAKLPLLFVLFPLLVGALRADAPPSAPAAKGLTCTLAPSSHDARHAGGGMESGPATLTYGGQMLVTTPGVGPVTGVGSPVFRRADGTMYDCGQVPANNTVLAVKTDAARQKVTVTYAWGALSCTYHPQGDQLRMTVGVHNTSHDTLLKVRVQVIALTFPAVPTIGTHDPGPFGTEGLRPVMGGQAANPQATPGILRMDYGAGVVDFCNEDVTGPAVVTVPGTDNAPLSTQYSFTVWLNAPLPPGEAETAPVSLRFGPAGTPLAALTHDLLRRYVAKYPFRLHWSDRRPIGMEMLAASGTHKATNPRGWFWWSPPDTTTPEGLAAFRAFLLNYADQSVGVLKDMNAQGMITWDTEGEEFGNATYYGDPRLVGKLAPEMEWKDAAGVATIDAYFQKFRQAGLRVGVCLRPQQIAFVDGVPQQQDSPDVVKTLRDKIAYCKKRWGCTLFYVDSTVEPDGLILADGFEAAAKANPDVLLIPENQNTRYYAYTAPLDDYRAGVAQTSPIVQDVYPGAFTVLLGVGDGPEGKSAANRAKLLAGVKRGDILMFPGWFPNDNNTFVKGIYQDAGPWKPATAIAEKSKP